jgi:hypothetical protein
MMTISKWRNVITFTQSGAFWIEGQNLTKLVLNLKLITYKEFSHTYRVFAYCEKIPPNIECTYSFSGTVSVETHNFSHFNKLKRDYTELHYFVLRNMGV